MYNWMLWIAASAVLSGNGFGSGRSPAIDSGQKAAPTRMEFEVASVKQNISDLPQRPYSNFPMGFGDIYSSNGGHLIARNWPFFFYLQFAYKMTDGQVEAAMEQVPDWTKTARFDIEAKVEGDPTKDQMRLMMQSLLAERFNLKIHHETRQVPVFVLVLAKPGKRGPKLVPHPASDTSCSNAPSVPEPAAARTVVGGFPVTCGVLENLPPSFPGSFAWGYRNATMATIASQMMSFGMLDRPVIDQTGLTGNYDFRIQFTPESPGFDAPGPTFIEALKEQAGLKLVPGKRPIDIIIVDHLERPTEN
jgi:uncharacterized protein (TIGR03435 family)